MTTKTTGYVTELRRCTGSARSGIEPHEAPVEDFPKQPSQKDGLGRMCTEHWKAYVKGLRKDALARKAAAPGGGENAGHATSKPSKATPPTKGAPRARAARPSAPSPKAAEIQEAEALIAEVDAPPGPEVVKRVGDADVQAALETAVAARMLAD